MPSPQTADHSHAQSIPLPPELLAIPGSGLIDLGMRIGGLTWPPHRLCQRIVSGFLTPLARRPICKRHDRKTTP